MKKLSMLLILTLVIGTVLPAWALAAHTQPIRNSIRPSGIEATDAPDTPVPPIRNNVRLPVRSGDADEMPVFDDPLMNIATEMVLHIHALASNADYRRVYGVMTDWPYCERIAATNPCDIRAVYRLDLPESVNGLFNLIGLQLSDAMLEQNLAFSVLSGHTHWNNRKGADALAEVVVLESCKPYPEPENFSACYYLLNCGGIPYWVTYTQGNTDIIMAEAAPLCLDDGETFDDVLAFLKNGFDGFSIYRITPIDPASR